VSRIFAAMPGGVNAPIRRLVRQPMARVALRGKLMHPYRRRQFREFGERSLVHDPMWIFGADHMAIGNDCLILHNAWLSVEPTAWSDHDPAVRLGDRVGIRPFCTLSASE
jgi:hypothetical protein